MIIIFSQLLLSTIKHAEHLCFPNGTINASHIHRTMPNESCENKSCNSDAVVNPKVAVVLLVGIPACGKSTLARELQKQFSKNDNNTDAAFTAKRTKDNRATYRLKHIEYDELEEFVLSSSKPERSEKDGDGVDEVRDLRIDAWNQARRKAVEKMEQEIQKTREKEDSAQASASINGASDDQIDHTVILMDDNFHLRGMRKHIHRILLRHKPIKFGILYLETPLDVCLERNRERSGRRKVPEETIKKMSSSLEPPRAAWEVESTKTIAVYDPSEDVSVARSNVEEIVKFIQGCPNIVDLPSDIDDLELQAADRTKTRESQIHNLDKLLRSYVGRVAKFDKTFAREANSARKNVMEKCKDGRIKIETLDIDCSAGLIDEFLDFIVPIDTTSVFENDTDAHLTIRSQLRRCLESP